MLARRQHLGMPGGGLAFGRPRSARHSRSHFIMIAILITILIHHPYHHHRIHHWVYHYQSHRAVVSSRRTGDVLIHLQYAGVVLMSVGVAYVALQFNLCKSTSVGILIAF